MAKTTKATKQTKKKSGPTRAQLQQIVAVLLPGYQELRDKVKAVHKKSIPHWHDWPEELVDSLEMGDSALDGLCTMMSAATERHLYERLETAAERLAEAEEES